MLLAWVTSGRQLRIPLFASSVALVGAIGRLKVNVGAGTFVSVALFVMVKFTPTLIT